MSFRKKRSWRFLEFDFYLDGEIVGELYLGDDGEVGSFRHVAQGVTLHRVDALKTAKIML